MIEKRFYADAIPYVSTEEYHLKREAAPHLEQMEHRPRLLRTAEIILNLSDVNSVVDLGAGDGGLLSLLSSRMAWGFDFQPANVEYAQNVRRVNVTYANYIADFDKINLKADLAVMTETIEHLPNPHGFLKKLFDETQIKYIVCSSPWNETELTSGGGHVWAWDREGYAKIITDAGWVIISHEDVVPRFQIVLAVRGK